MESVLDRVIQLSEVLKKLQPLKTEYQQKLDKKFRLEFSYNSNHIEGNTLTYGETKLLLLFDETQSGSSHDFREYEEMKAHDVAFTLIKDWAADQDHPLTETYIKNLNEIILVKPFWKDALTAEGQHTRREIKVGDYKAYANSVRLPNGEMFHYASPADTPIQMGELIDWYRQEEASGALHPVAVAALFHYKFVCIHPFDDGNGRISRLLMNYILLRNGFPPVIIKSADKKNYLHALHQADIGDTQAFINYITEQLLWSLEISVKAANGENIDEPGDLDKRLLLIEKDLEKIDPENTIQRRLSKDVFLEIYNEWLSDLIKKGVEGIEKFNHFFSGMNHSANILNAPYAKFTDESPESVAATLLDKIKKELGKNPHEIKIALEASYGVFKKAGQVSFGCNYKFEIVFSSLKYEVFVDEFIDEDQLRSPKKILEKLLHQPLKEAEMDRIVDSLKKTILDNIDFNTQKLGLR